MKKIIYIFLTIFCIKELARADDNFESLELALLLKAQSAEALDLRVLAMQNLKVLARSCNLQIHENLMPTYCFILLDMKKKLGIKNKHSRDYDQYRQICEKNAQTLTLLEVDNYKILPKKCREMTLKRLKINRYKAQGIVFE